ncbi:Tat pathway signal sequence domain protein [Streptomyces tendae]|uniref:Tat pathway signal sequence domain protein n=1 Tax=Streptomyces tendae TaxID=1932 RepID=A0ABX5ZVI4_STRTE|nr:Tat pathway signal sequence domain protein [Streptomyces tendae]QER88433.1 Tat pathway signal sequence domain protein [Streptomyces tendae]
MSGSGVGPVEPEGDTHVRDTDPAPDARHVFLPRWSPRRRRTVAGAFLAAAVLAGGTSLYLTRPRPEPPPDPPFPSQVTAFTYLDMQVRGSQGTARTFEFTIQTFMESGPPVTVLRISQPYAGLTLTTAPTIPFGVKSGSPRKITVTAEVTECGKVPRNAGLPFLDVTLRNTHAKEVHSFILGARYAQDLSRALQVACSNEFR